MNRVAILLGGNIGNVGKTFSFAIGQLSEIGRITKKSSLYKTEPWGFHHENDFFNQAVIIETPLSPLILLQELLKIEKKAGRTRNNKDYEARTLDLDILFFNDEIIKTNELEIPHPKLHLRRFALAPLAEIVPDHIHPVFHASIETLLKKCPDNCKITGYKI